MSNGATDRASDVIELTENQLDTVSGGLAPSDYSFDVEKVLSIGSQSSGAGAGKVTFNPF